MRLSFDNTFLYAFYLIYNKFYVFVFCYKSSYKLIEMFSFSAHFYPCTIHQNSSPRQIYTPKIEISHVKMANSGETGTGVDSAYKNNYVSGANRYWPTLFKLFELVSRMKKNQRFSQCDVGDSTLPSNSNIHTFFEY